MGIDPSPHPFDAYLGKEPFVFVSYAHKDKNLVYPLITKMNNDSVRIWYDEGIPPSEKWMKIIAEKIQTCNIFLVFLSPDAVKSENVMDEISFAKDRWKDKEIQFFIVYLNRTTLTTELRFSIGRIQALMKYEVSEVELFRKLYQIFDQTVFIRQKESRATELWPRFQKLMNRLFDSNVEEMSDLLGILPAEMMQYLPEWIKNGPYIIDQNHIKKINDALLLEKENQEAQKKAETEALKIRTEQEARKKAEVEAFKLRTEQETRKKAEVEAFKLRTEQETRKKVEIEVYKLKTEQESQKKVEPEALKLKTEQEPQKKTEIEANYLNIDQKSNKKGDNVVKIISEVGAVGTNKKGIRKLLLAGSTECEIATLMRRYTTGTFQENTNMKIGVDFFLSTINTNYGQATIQFWHIDPALRWRHMVPSFCAGASGALLFFHPLFPETFYELDDWIKNIQNNTKNIPILLASTHSDLIDDGQSPTILQEDIENFLSRHRINGYYRISSKTGYNMKELFVEMTKLMLFKKND